MFKSFSHDQKMSLLKANSLCLNCFKANHFFRKCPSTHRCHKCHGPHHTLLHLDKGEQWRDSSVDQPISVLLTHTHAAIGLKTNLLLMTCQVRVKAPNGHLTTAHGLLDLASTISLISERLAQQLWLPCSKQLTQVSGVAGIPHKSCSQSVTFFSISSLHTPDRDVFVSAVVVPKVTCNLPNHHVSVDHYVRHLAGLQLVDPDFNRPSQIDLLLGVDCTLQWCSRAGGLVYQDHLWHLKPRLVRFSLVVRMITLSLTLQSLCTRPFSQVMMTSRSFGRLRSVSLINRLCQLKIAMWWSTSMTVTLVHLKDVSLFLYQGSLMSNS